MCESKRQNTLRIFWRRRDIFVLKAHKTKSREERRYVRGCPTKKKANDARGSRKMTAFIHVYKGFLFHNILTKNIKIFYFVHDNQNAEIPEPQFFCETGT